MALDQMSFLFILIIILVGFYLKQVWLSIIFAIALLLILAMSRTGKKEIPVPTGPRVQPIVVKRKYVGPKSIYPEKMEILFTPDTPSDWREYGPKQVGNVIGSAFRWAYKKGKE